jgi:Flp pilus assembly pilin Flp
MLELWCWLRLRLSATGRDLAADEAGQAMAEYAIVVAALMGGLVTMGFSFLPEFIRAFQAYYDSFYIMLNLPFP